MALDMPPPGLTHGPGKAGEKLPVNDRDAVFQNMEQYEQKRQDRANDEKALPLL